MRAVLITGHGGPEVLVTADVPAPRPGPGEIVVDVTLASVNFLDVYHRTGFRPKPTPFTPGIEGAGVVAGVGAGVTGHAVGDRVAWVQPPGSYAEQMTMPAWQAVRVPDGVTDHVAAAGLLHGLSARYLTSITHPVGPQDVVLVQAAAWGTRLLIIALAKWLGARVIASVGGPRGAKLARAYGADEVIIFTKQSVPREVRALTGGAGVTVVYDGRGQAGFEPGLASLRPCGTYVQVSERESPLLPFDPALLTAGSFKFTRPVLGHHIATAAELRAGAEDVFRWIQDGTLRIRVGRCFPLGEASSAHRHLENGYPTAKPLIMPRQASGAAGAEFRA